MSNTSFRQQLYGLLGDLPDRHRPITAERHLQEQRDGYVLEHLTLDLNGIEMVQAYFVRPTGATGRMPTVLFNHSHGGEYQIGKDELLSGRRYLQPTPYAVDLTKRGYAALCIDHWCFGQRSHTTESDMFKLMLWRGQVMWGMMVYDSLRALDYLISRPDVDSARIATIGMSMGSTMAWWLAAIDERIKVCIDLHCLTDFDALIAAKGLSKHGLYYFVPGLLKYFSTSQINALIAPRPHLALAGNLDALTPVAGLDRIDADLKKVYAEKGVEQAWRMVRYEVAHQETADGRQEVLGFLNRWL